MRVDTQAIRNYFAKLNLDASIADIYLALHTNGPQTISELSRSSGVERTRVYRLIDSLLETNLIEVESHYKRGIVKAAPIANLHILIAQKEQELKSLQDELGLIEQVLARNSLSNPATRVQFYRGVEGIRQMQWNQVKSKTDSLSIVDEPLNNTLGKTFTMRWADTMNANGVRLRILVSPHFRQVIREWYAQHKVPELIADIESRLLEPSTFQIRGNMDIWENVVAYYNWQDGDVFGIEIYNQDVANTQRQFFEMLWAKAARPPV